jgi:hypothetical protein
VGRRESRVGFLAEVGPGCVVAGLATGLAMVGGQVMRAAEDVRQIVEGVGVPFWWCLEYVV